MKSRFSGILRIRPGKNNFIPSTSRATVWRGHPRRGAAEGLPRRLMMSGTDQEYTQSLGLDVGTSRIVVARNADKKYRYESQLNAFLTLPYSRLAEELMLREKVF